MRLQLHAGFTFADAARLVPYMADLGVSHLYASPILTARAGSPHGYDVVDPTQVNPELGGEAGLRDLVAELRAAGLGLIVDIVPNHMAVGGSDNAWWQDVLRHGPASRYAGFFDIDWNPADPSLQGRLLAPFLGRPYGEALQAGELQLTRDATGAAVVRYFDDTYPVAPRDHAEIAGLGLAAYDPATAEGRARLHRLLERQHYRLAWWGTAGDEINWRRFFDINGLVGLRIERDEVFEATHATLFRLYAEGLIDGMRVDHVDGLTDPPGYCRRLRARLEALGAKRPAAAPATRPYIVVEKILGAGETMPADWGVDGTSGYDFMDSVSAVQHDPAAERSLAFFWSAVSGRPADFSTEEALARRQIVERGFDAQLEATASTLHRLARLDPLTRDTTQPAIRRALLTLLVHFPVYRTYDAGMSRSPGDQAAFAQALEAAKADAPISLHPVLDWIDRWLGGENPGKPGAALRQAATRRFQQLSAPLAAKAVEDTAFYRYGRLLSRNDVGFNATLLGAEPAAFHAANAARAEHFPDALLATATHDHKRGEDLRARLAVLSEIPDVWQATLQRWMAANAAHRRPAGPSPGDEAQLCQMVVGAWPMTLSAGDSAGCKAFAERLAGWQGKAIREAKLRGDWTGPDEAYEAAARDFLFSLLAPGSLFPADAAEFVRRIAPAGAVNGLAQTLLKLTVPGVPDFFQGTEFWDFSLVDPDNRRPVDFAVRIEALRAAASPAALAAEWRDGRVKQAVIARTLALRRAAPALFARGRYCPLDATGPLARHVLAFMRVWGDDVSLTLVPHLPQRLLDGRDAITIPPEAWRDTALHCPPDMVGRRLRDALGDKPGAPLPRAVPVGALLGDCPVSLHCSVEAA
ncbi:MAG TPA: malto-oligosyltrehalose synthase [Acetobacteraceae bacterium]|nr:malto-oligosyltrehalose synthase [Acetobacteraceae bacterium]